MKLDILITLLSQLFALMTPDVVKSAIDKGLDYLEDKINETATPVDDATVLPIIGLIRTTLGIPDQDGNGVPIKITGAEFSKLSMLSGLLTGLFSAIPPELIKGFIDSGLDVVEDAIKNSSTKVDDLLATPIIGMIRVTFSIPDND